MSCKSDLMPKRRRRERHSSEGPANEEDHSETRLDQPRRGKRRNSRHNNDYGVTSSWTCERKLYYICDKTIFFSNYLFRSFFLIENFVAFIPVVLEQLLKRAIAYSNQKKCFA